MFTASYVAAMEGDGARDSGAAIMSRGGRHSDAQRLDSFMRDTEEWHQQEPLDPESYEPEVDGDEASDDDGEGENADDDGEGEDAHQGEQSAGSSSSPEKTSRLGTHQFGQNTPVRNKRKSSGPSPVWTVIMRLKDPTLMKNGSTHVCIKCGTFLKMGYNKGGGDFSPGELLKSPPGICATGQFNPVEVFERVWSYCAEGA